MQARGRTHNARTVLRATSRALDRAHSRARSGTHVLARLRLRMRWRRRASCGPRRHGRVRWGVRRHMRRHTMGVHAQPWSRRGSQGEAPAPGRACRRVYARGRTYGHTHTWAYVRDGAYVCASTRTVHVCGCAGECEHGRCVCQHVRGCEHAWSPRHGHARSSCAGAMRVRGLAWAPMQALRPGIMRAVRPSGCGPLGSPGLVWAYVPTCALPSVCSHLCA